MRLKSIWAVVAGFLTVFILSVVTDTILEAIGIFPPPDKGLYNPWLLTFALFYRTAYAVLGGYFTAKLAPQNPMKHVNVLAVLGVIGATLGLVSTWGKGLGPEWYPILLLLFSYPAVWYGGKLQVK